MLYSDEVWTGIEYQVASHLMRMGLVREGLEVVRVCRDRYDGRIRNPFDEYAVETALRLGIEYDVLVKESDIIRQRFWDRAFDLLKRSGAVVFETEGKNAGCWVMDLPGVEQGAGEDQKVIVRSNGTVTYVGKDIAYQMWKFGLLGRDFDYAPFDWGSDAPLYPLWETVTGGIGGNTTAQILNSRWMFRIFWSILRRASAILSSRSRSSSRARSTASRTSRRRRSAARR